MIYIYFCPTRGPYPLSHMGQFSGMGVFSLAWHQAPGTRHQGPQLGNGAKRRNGGGGDQSAAWLASRAGFFSRSFFSSRCPHWGAWSLQGTVLTFFIFLSGAGGLPFKSDRSIGIFAWGESGTVRIVKGKWDIENREDVLVLWRYMLSYFNTIQGHLPRATSYFLFSFRIHFSTPFQTQTKKDPTPFQTKQTLCSNILIYLSLSFVCMCTWTFSYSWTRFCHGLQNVKSPVRRSNTFSGNNKRTEYATLLGNCDNECYAARVWRPCRHLCTPGRNR